MSLSSLEIQFVNHLQNWINHREFQFNKVRRELAENVGKLV